MPEPADPNIRLELDRSRAETLSLKRQLAEQKKQTDDLLASSSWQLTAPFRAVASWVKRHASRARGAHRVREAATSIALEQYRQWLKSYGTIDPGTRAAMEKSVESLAVCPIISIIMPVYNIKLKWVHSAIQSVREQIYPHFELCISDDASTLEGTRQLLMKQQSQDSRIRLNFRKSNGHISVNSNSALTLATGSYIALLDADDQLSPDALYWVAHAISANPDVDLLFSDEDKINEEGQRFDPYFKSAWNPALMLSQNAFSHLGVFRRSLVEQVGSFREGYEGSQDHDLVLRCAAATRPERIRHIPRVLYHWRTVPGSASAGVHSKSYAWDAGRRAIQDHLKRIGTPGSVGPGPSPYYQVSYDEPIQAPRVSVIVVADLSAERTIQSLNATLKNTVYKDFELIVSAEHSTIQRAHSSKLLALATDTRVRLLARSGVASFAHEINSAAAQSRSSVLCLLGEAVEPLTPDWLDQLVARAVLDGVAISAPMICGRSGELLHAGIVLGGRGVACHPFRGCAAGSAGYFGRAALEQDYTCVSSTCMVIRRNVFQDAGGLDDLPPPLNAMELCLRVRRLGLRALWVPSARMQQSTANDCRNSKPAEHNAVRLLHERWDPLIKDDPCYNPNLSLDPDRTYQLDVRSPEKVHTASPQALLATKPSRTAMIWTSSPGRLNGPHE